MGEDTAKQPVFLVMLGTLTRPLSPLRRVHELHFVVRDHPAQGACFVSKQPAFSALHTPAGVYSDSVLCF